MSDIERGDEKQTYDLTVDEKKTLRTRCAALRARAAELGHKLSSASMSGVGMRPLVTRVATVTGAGAGADDDMIIPMGNICTHPVLFIILFFHL